MISLLFCCLALPQSQAEFDITDNTHWDGFGMKVFFLDDLTGDGFLEFGVSAYCTDYNGTNSGSVYIINGATLAPYRLHHGPNQQDRFGEFAAVVGDMDGDGILDYAGGARNADFGLPNSGSVVVFSGADGSEIHRFNGTQTDSAFGLCFTGFPDIDGDGIDEIIVGAPEEDSFDGKIYFYSGSTGLLMGSVAGTHPGGRFGLSMAPIDDVTGDGKPDLVVGSPYANGEAGNVSFVDSSSLQVVGSIPGLFPGGRLGWQVANAGDTNNNGRSDILVGEPCNDRVYLLTDTGDLIRKHNGSGGPTKDGYGHAFCPAGDVNSDGFADYLLGHPGEWDGQNYVADGGGAEIFSGLDGTVLVSYTTTDLDDGFGSSMAYSPLGTSAQVEVLIGAPAGGDLAGGHAPGIVSGRHYQ